MSPAEDAARRLPQHFQEKSPLTDTAGTPWAGRDSHTASPFPDDDGSAPPQLEAALLAHRAGDDPSMVRLVHALATSRILVPIMAVKAEEGTTAHGVTGDHGADMAMVSVTAPDGSRILPVFSAAAELTTWRSDARPVPVHAAQGAQAAVQEGCTSLLLDPATPGPDGSPILLPRSILWALAQGRDWIPPSEDPEVSAALEEIAEGIGPVLSLTATPGNRAEVTLEVRLRPGLDRDQVRSVVDAVSAGLSGSVLLTDRISSVTLSLVG